MIVRQDQEKGIGRKVDESCSSRTLPSGGSTENSGRSDSETWRLHSTQVRKRRRGSQGEDEFYHLIWNKVRNMT